MKFVADKAIPFLEGLFDPYGVDVVFKDGRAIAREDLMDAEVLITRTRTRCDARLLEGTGIRMIATATIGTDHIDLPWCAEHGIAIASAPGCNAGGVMDYVFSSLYGIASRKAIRLDGVPFGIIGVGHVGKKVEQMARKLGFELLLNDPPRAAAEGPDGFCSLDYLLSHAGIVTLHTPLSDETRGMADASFFAKMRPETIFINASRGEVVDEDALLEAMPKLGAVCLDTWCNEPNINLRLMDRVDIATPHVAGYSYQGKQNGTAAVVRAIARRYGFDALIDWFPATGGPEDEAIYLDVQGKNQGEVAALFQYNYPVFTDDFMFRLDPGGFERIRGAYHYRREFYI